MIRTCSRRLLLPTSTPPLRIWRPTERTTARSTELPRGGYGERTVSAGSPKGATRRRLQESEAEGMAGGCVVLRRALTADADRDQCESGRCGSGDGYPAGTPGPEEGCVVHRGDG